MDYLELLKALGLIAGTHTANHLSVANDTGAPARMQGLNEVWDRPKGEYTETTTKTPVRSDVSAGPGIPGPTVWDTKTTRNYMPSAKETDRQGAGFAGQDVMNSALDTPESNAANALYKGLYLATGGLKTSGDFRNMEENSGNRYTKPLVGASAFYNAYKAANPDNNVDVNFTTMNQGTPGLMATIPLDQNLIPVLSRMSNRK
jgi:hypothetical protein